MKKVLFTPHNNFLPIAKLLHERDFEILSTHNEFVNALNNVDVPARILSLDQRDTQRVHGESLNVVNTSVNGSVPAYLSESVQRFFKNEIGAFLFPKVSGLISAILATDKEKPDIIVVQDDVQPITRALAMWAREHGVPCLHVPHAVYIDTEEERGLPGTDIHDIITASHLVTGGSYQTNWYIDRGMNPQNIFQTGLPQFDNMVQASFTHERSKRLLNLDFNRPVVTFASSWRQDTNLQGCHDGIQQVYTAFLTAVKDVDAQIVIKLHPNAGEQSIHSHIVEADKLGVNCIVTAKHLPIVLKASDVVFAYGPSNILVEAAIVPTRLMTTHGYEDDDVVTKVGDEPSSYDINMSTAMVLSQKVPDTYDFLVKYAGHVDGRSNKRIVEVIEQLC